jgi:anti-anti-sigma factor
LATRQFSDRTEVEGEIDLLTAEVFSAAVEEASMRSCTLDLTGVTFMDSNGLRILIAAAALRDGTPLVVRSSGVVDRLFGVAAPGGVPGLRFEG